MDGWNVLNRFACKPTAHYHVSQFLIPTNECRQISTIQYVTLTLKEVSYSKSNEDGVKLTVFLYLQKDTTLADCIATTVLVAGTILWLREKESQVFHERRGRRITIDWMATWSAPSESALLQMTEKSLNFHITVMIPTPCELGGSLSWPNRH